MAYPAKGDSLPGTVAFGFKSNSLTLRRAGLMIEGSRTAAGVCACGGAALRTTDRKSDSLIL